MESNKFSTMLHKRTNKITHVLIYAILEWTLIFLLLLNSLFSYFILKFALYFGLKPPCFLCSRLDHVLDSHKKENEDKPNFSSYKDIICEQHAAEISKIGYCSHHRKLVELQHMCEDCSTSSTTSSHDPQLFKWMTKIGIVKTDEEEEDDDGIVKRCSCCDGVIKTISKDSSMDFVIKGRDLLGDCFTDQKVQVNSDQADDSKFGYQVLNNGIEAEDEEEEKQKSEEEDVILETEKEPLLHDNDSNGKNEIFTTHNLCLEMLPQHLEFYIDHDDYRLIPVGLNHGNSIKVVGEEDCKEISHFSKEFELFFEGDELVFPGKEVRTSKDLPCIQEEDESVTEKKIDSSENNERVFERDELLEEATITENLHIPKDREKMDGSEKIELVSEGDGLIAECEIISESSPKEEESAVESLPLQDDEENMDCSENFELNFEGGELLQEENITENMQISNDEEKMDGSRKVELVLNGNEVMSECEIISESSPKDEDKSAIENPAVHEDEPEEEEEEEEGDSQSSQPQMEKERGIETLLFSEEQEVTATAESRTISDEPESDNQDVEADSQAAVETPSTPSVSKEDNESHLKTDVTDTEKDQNPTYIASHLKEQESHTISDNVVSEVSTSYPHDADISKATINEVEEEKVPDTPTSSESVSHLQRKALLLGRRESVTEESLDGMSMVGEQESGEMMEKLKVDLLSERKTLRALYKELEEERNASAIAANQTMAMITRLQEEKATMQMEALQYQRMMEEQSEYDQEALQMMNELVVKREKEKQELEKELEVYRKKVIDYEEREKLRMLCRRRSRNSSASCSYGEESDGVSIDLNQEVKDQEEENGSFNIQEENGHQDTPADAVLCLQDSLSGFEDERQAILGQLKVLEEKLFTLAEEEEEHFENMKPFEQFYEENGKDFEGNGDDTNGFVHANGKHHQEKRINGSMPKRLLPLFDAVDLLESPNGELNGNEEHEFHITKFELEKKRFAIEEEVDHVYERLQSLEADREFLKHCIGSLKKGEKGLDLLQEILQHLRDLKNVELQAMKNTDQCASV